MYIAFGSCKGVAVAFKNTSKTGGILQTRTAMEMSASGSPFPYKLQSLGQPAHSATMPSARKLYVTLLIIKPLRGIAKGSPQKHQAGGLIQILCLAYIRFQIRFRIPRPATGPGQAPRNFKNLIALLQTFAVQADSQLRPTRRNALVPAFPGR